MYASLKLLSPKGGLTRQGDLDSRSGVATHGHYTYTEMPAVEQCCVPLCNRDKIRHPQLRTKDKTRRKELKHKIRHWPVLQVEDKVNDLRWSYYEGHTPWNCQPQLQAPMYGTGKWIWLYLTHRTYWQIEVQNKGWIYLALISDYDLQKYTC